MSTTYFQKTPFENCETYFKRNIQNTSRKKKLNHLYRIILKIATIAANGLKTQLCILKRNGYRENTIYRINMIQSIWRFISHLAWQIEFGEKLSTDIKTIFGNIHGNRSKQHMEYTKKTWTWQIWRIDNHHWLLSSKFLSRSSRNISSALMTGRLLLHTCRANWSEYGSTESYGTHILLQPLLYKWTATESLL